MPDVKLPKQVEQDPRHEAVRRALSADTRLLWPGGKRTVAHLALTPALRQALAEARGQLEQGFEGAERVLEAEAKGLVALRQKTGEAQGSRVSRLLLLAADGSERFYRHAESLLARHEERLLVAVVDAPGEGLGEAALGPGRLARAVLVGERDAVSRVLLSLAGGESVA